MIHKIGRTKFNTNTHTVIRGKIEIHLPPKQFLLLKMLIENKGKIVSVDEAMKYLEYDETNDAINPALISQHICRLRKFLGADGKYIQTINRFGWIIK